MALFLGSKKERMAFLIDEKIQEDRCLKATTEWPVRLTSQMISS